MENDIIYRLIFRGVEEIEQAESPLKFWVDHGFDPKYTVIEVSPDGGEKSLSWREVFLKFRHNRGGEPRYSHA